jgi:2-isopropylmalate synthase
MKKVKLYDTTLRDGIQGEGVSASVADKLNITKKLDELGIDYIEGGNPASNQKDIEYFSKVKELRLRNAVVCAFGSTIRAKEKPSTDAGLKKLLSAKTSAVTIFGKSWLLHVKDVLRVPPEKNLQMIEQTISYLKKKGREVIYDAEHFFDGYRDNPEYAVDTLKAAVSGGADALVLCDTNGGSIPCFVNETVAKIHGNFDAGIGIHTHNDAGMAVANSITAVQAGATHVQGTINGYGERCGNADLCAIIPTLKWKLNINCVSDKQSEKLLETSRYISEIMNIVPKSDQPFVGASAFAHKGGMHVDAVHKNPLSFEHIKPELVGNKRRILVSEVSGKRNILEKAADFGVNLNGKQELTAEIVEKIKELEYSGYHFEAADASLEILIKKIVGKYKEFFRLGGFRVSVELRDDKKLISEATIKVNVGGALEHTASEGEGPVNALDNALRKALERFYPSIKEIRLIDFRVRVLDARSGTAAKVRVLIESGDKKDTWQTVGVSENIIEASWQALVDSVDYKLMKNREKSKM